MKLDRLAPSLLILPLLLLAACGQSPTPGAAPEPVKSTQAVTPGKLVAWGSDDRRQVSDVPTDANYIAVDTYGSHGIALRQDGSLKSWGDDQTDFGDFDMVTDTPTDKGYVAVAAGYTHMLALKGDGSIVAWGYDGYGISDPPDGTGYTAISAGSDHSLALTADGHIKAWGADFWKQVSYAPPNGGYIAIDATNTYSLALTADGSIVGWGANDYGQVTGAPTDKGYIAIAGGCVHGVALKGDGSIVAWGGDDEGQVSGAPKDGGYVATASGCNFSLALKADGSIVAWGQDVAGTVTNAPKGKGYTAIAAGRGYALALTADTTPPTVNLVTPSGFAIYQQNQAVSAEYSCADAGSGIRSCTGPVASGAALDTSTPGSFEFTVTATDNVGNETSASQMYYVFPPDTTSPTINLVTPADEARYEVGQTVVVEYSCADRSGTGIKSCAGPLPNGANLDTSRPGSYRFIVFAEDNAGVESSTDHYYFVVPRTAPSVTLEQASGQADPTGESPVSFTATFSEPVTGFEGSDVTLGGTAGATTATVSEVAPNNGTVFTVAVSGMTGSGTVTASLAENVVADATGNGNTASTSLDNEVTYTAPVVDTTAPTITLTTPVNGATYEQGQAVVAEYACADDGSGVKSCTGPVASGTALDTSTPGSYAFTVAAQDNAGNKATVTHAYTVAAPDTTAPTINLTTPGNGATYVQGQAVTAEYGCTDEEGGSGVATCTGTVASGAAIDTGTPGSYSFTVTATDAAGNETSVTHPYTIAAPPATADRYLIDFETAPTNRLIYSVQLGSGIVHQEGNTPKNSTVPVVGKRRLNASIVQQHTARVVNLYGSDRLIIASPNSNTPAPTGGRIKLSFTNFDPNGVTLTSLTLSNLTSRNPYLTFYYVDGRSSRQPLPNTARGGSVVVPLNVPNLRAVDIYAANAYAVDDVRFTDEAQSN